MKDDYSSSHNPEVQIEKGNPWYVGEQHAMNQNKSTNRVIENRARFFKQIISAQKQVVQVLYNRKAKVLDAGCGDGVNLKILASIEGIELNGLDYNPLRVKRAKELFPEVNVYQADLLSVLSREKFDVILLSQVLEHIEQDQVVLQNLKALLNPGGILILGVPNEGCLLAKVRNQLLQRKEFIKSDHVNFYRRRPFKKRLEREGFVIEGEYLENFFLPHSKLHALVVKSSVGSAIMTCLQKLFPSQVAGYYFALRT